MSTAFPHTPFAFRAAPRAPAARTGEAGAVPSAERPLIDLVSFVMLLSVLTQKMALPGTNNVELPFFFVVPMCAWLLVKRHAAISVAELALYLGLSALLIVWQILNPLQPNQTFKACLFLIVMYFPFLMRVRASRAAYELLLKRFQLICLLIAAMVALGWATQLVGLGMPNAELFMPRSWLFTNYNYIQPVHWGSPYTKPNGFFMLETSHTSQLLAMGVLIELCVLRRMPILLALAAALLSTFGGTGLLMLLLASPVVLFYLRPKLILFALLAAPLLYLLAFQIGLTSNVAGRAGEITGERDQTSGYGRFILPWLVVESAVDRGASVAFFGMGAGNLPSVGGHEVYVVPPIQKMLTEYGLFLGLAWLVWFHATLFRRGAPAIVTVAVLLQYDFMNGSLLVPINVYYCLWMTSLFVVPPPVQATARPWRGWARNWLPRTRPAALPQPAE